MSIRRYYGLAEIPHSNLSSQDSMHLVAFASRAHRDAWVDAEDNGALVRYLQTCGEERRAVTQAEAITAMTRLLGGYDRAALGTCATWPSTIEEAEEADRIAIAQAEGK